MLLVRCPRLFLRAGWVNCLVYMQAKAASKSADTTNTDPAGADVTAAPAAAPSGAQVELPLQAPSKSLMLAQRRASQRGRQRVLLKLIVLQLAAVRCLRMASRGRRAKSASCTARRPCQTRMQQGLRSCRVLVHLLPMDSLPQARAELHWPSQSHQLPYAKRVAENDCRTRRRMPQRWMPMHLQEVQTLQPRARRPIGPSLPDRSCRALRGSE